MEARQIGSRPMIGLRLAMRIERTIYVIAGLPVAIRGSSMPGPAVARQIRGVFARRFWRPASFAEAMELAAGLFLAPIAVPLGALWYTVRNGPVIRRREG